MSKSQLITADVMNWFNLANRYGYKQNYYHALLLDPPYHLTSITERFSKGTPAKYGTDGAFQRASKGFMGQTWDGGDLAFNPELWAALKEMLLPGAFCFAFAGSRGWHRMAVAIEDAGFIMHPTLWNYWSYGSGFPKAARIKKDGEDIPEWQSHRYSLQMLKPSVEPILCFQKPYEGKPLDSIVKTGAGALNIDGGRVGNPLKSFVDNPEDKIQQNTYGKYGTSDYDGTKGRWPSNLLLQHHPDCKRVGVKKVKSSSVDGIVKARNTGVYETRGKARQDGYNKQGYADPDGLETVADWQCVDDCPVKKLDEQTKGTRAEKPSMSGDGEYSGSIWGSGKDHKTNIDTIYTDSGGASRFFFQSHFVYEQIAAADPVRYVAKAGSKERNAGLGELPDQIRHRVNAGGLENEPRWSPIETKNIHPTVKPIALTKYLASLLLPPDSYSPRRILVPFAGSGSEMIGALLAGWDEVTGIEMTKKYIPIANARLKWWAQWLRWNQNDINVILEAHKTVHPQQIRMEF